jgi:hypothetical protein
MGWVSTVTKRRAEQWRGPRETGIIEHTPAIGLCDYKVSLAPDESYTVDIPLLYIYLLVCRVCLWLMTL